MGRLLPCASPADYAEAVRLTKEYAAWLGFDLGFQGFERELAEFPVMYGPPAGPSCWRARTARSPAGSACGAWRPASAR